MLHVSKVRLLSTGRESKDVHPFFVESGDKLAASQTRLTGPIWTIAINKVVGD